MENKIIFKESSSENPKDTNLTKTVDLVESNIFNEKLNQDEGNSKFPDWDIIPPSQFINPRIKQK
jgi:hypothetical protein